MLTFSDSLDLPKSARVLEIGAGCGAITRCSRRTTGPSGTDRGLSLDEALSVAIQVNALDAMPSRQAALLWAREVEGQSYEELCTRFAMTEPAVRSVLTRARKALRKARTELPNPGRNAA